jgi:hypothetical protein
MADRDRSPERISYPIATWDIEFSDQWQGGHMSRGERRNQFRLSLDGRFAEVRVSNWADNGVLFLIDADCIDKISGLTWQLAKAKRKKDHWKKRWNVLSNCKYRKTKPRDPRIDGYPVTVLLSRYLLDYQGPLTMDHINRDILDNRRANLRVATSEQQGKNKGLNVKNKTGENGIIPLLSLSRWRISYNLPNGNTTTKRWERDPNDEEAPQVVTDWINEMRENGYTGTLRPRAYETRPTYRFAWSENGRHDEYFPLTEEGFNMAVQFQKDTYARIENLNGYVPESFSSH